jgi:hypothetical protein
MKPVAVISDLLRCPDSGICWRSLTVPANRKSAINFFVTRMTDPGIEFWQAG